MTVACLLLVKASIALSPFIHTSIDMGTITTDAVYRSPALIMRMRAEEMEKNDKAIEDFREALGKCQESMQKEKI